jgi:hypothetical protein
MATVPQEQYINCGVCCVLNQALGRVADALLSLNLNAMFSGLDIRIISELLKERVSALPLLVRLTGCARIPRKLLDEND